MPSSATRVSRRNPVRRPQPGALAVAIGLILAGVGPVLANPDPGQAQVVHGSATFSQPGAGHLQITNTPGTVINWQQFGINPGELTHFQQNNTASTVLNRVVGGNASQILGDLTSNGRVYLINPRGIVFGQQAVVDTAGFIASTLNISDADFIHGRLHFEGIDAADIENHGFLHAGPGGEIVLIAPNIENTGSIVVEDGNLILAAGRSITLTSLDLDGIGFEVQAPGDSVVNLGELIARKGSVGAFAGTLRNSGRIEASGVATDADGNIVLFAGDRLSLETDSHLVARQADAGGQIAVQAGGFAAVGGALTVSGDDGGEVQIQAGSLLTNAQIDASGSGQGGRVDIHADGRLVATAAARVDAGGQAGAGGSIRIEADEHLYSSGDYLADGAHGGGVDLLSAGTVSLAGARVDAGGREGGGQVRIGGGNGGQDASVTNAQVVRMNSTTEVGVDAFNHGDGGSIAIWSEARTEVTASLSARGGATGGDGGLVEVSGAEGLAYAGQADLQAPAGDAGDLLLDPTNINITADATIAVYGVDLLDPDPGAGNSFGNDNFGFDNDVLVLGNGNIAVADSQDDLAAIDAGAIYLFDPQTGQLISSLTGSLVSDRVGNNGLFEVGLNGDAFVAASPNWDLNGNAANVGAATYLSGSGFADLLVAPANSIIGQSANDSVANEVTVLANGNYVVTSILWDSLVGQLPTDVGAVTLGNGASGTVGLVVNETNSLVGTSTGDQFGRNVVPLVQDATNNPNANYVIGSTSWDRAGQINVGIITLASGIDGSSVVSGGFGAANETNSLVGSVNLDNAGLIITPLVDGHVVVGSRDLDIAGGAAGVGHATFINGGTGELGARGSGVFAGAVDASNSFLGASANDNMSNGGIFALANGNYVVTTPNFTDQQGNAAVGAVTTCTSANPCTGSILAANNLTGDLATDFVGASFGDNITPLDNGDFVLSVATWHSNQGIVLVVDGVNGLPKFGPQQFGPIAATNGLTGSIGGDGTRIAVDQLATGNVAVQMPLWDNGAVVDAGAVTVIDTTSGAIGGQTGVTSDVVTITNSIVGTTASDEVGGRGVTALDNGNFVIASGRWDLDAGTINVGAITLASGIDGSFVVGGGHGAVATGNSLHGQSSGDFIGLTFESVFPLVGNSNFVVSSGSWDNPNGAGGGVANDAGAVTFVNGTTGQIGGTAQTSGAVTEANSLVGSRNQDNVGNDNPEGFEPIVLALSGGDYAVFSPLYDNNGVANTGAVTLGDGDTGVAGLLNDTNSIFGAVADDRFGLAGGVELNPRTVVVSSPSADFSAVDGNGRVTLVSRGAPDLLFADARLGPDVTLTAGSVAFALAQGNLLLQATNDITVAAGANIDVTPAAGVGNLTLQAGRSILLNGDIATGGGDLFLLANDTGPVDAQGVAITDQPGARDPGAAVIAMADGTLINTNGLAGQRGDVFMRMDNALRATNSTEAGNIELGTILADEVLFEMISLTPAVTGSSLVNANPISPGTLAARSVYVDHDVGVGNGASSIGTSTSPLVWTADNISAHTHGTSNEGINLTVSALSGGPVTVGGTTFGDEPTTNLSPLGIPGLVGFAIQGLEALDGGGIVLNSVADLLVTESIASSGSTIAPGLIRVSGTNIDTLANGEFFGPDVDLAATGNIGLLAPVATLADRLGFSAGPGAVVRIDANGGFTGTAVDLLSSTAGSVIQVQNLVGDLTVGVGQTVQLTDAGTSSMGLSSGVGGGSVIIDGNVRATGSGNFQLNADEIDINTVGGLNGAAGSAVVFDTITPGLGITIGDDLVLGDLQLTSTDIGNLGAGIDTVVIGVGGFNPVDVVTTVDFGGRTLAIDTSSDINFLQVGDGLSNLGGITVITATNLVRNQVLPAVDVLTDFLDLGLSGGVTGDPLETDVANLSASVDTGDLSIRNARAINLQSVSVTGSVSRFDLVNQGDITVGSVTTDASAGTVNLVTEAGSGGNIVAGTGSLLTTFDLILDADGSVGQVIPVGPEDFVTQPLIASLGTGGSLAGGAGNGPFLLDINVGPATNSTTVRGLVVNDPTAVLEQPVVDVTSTGQLLINSGSAAPAVQVTASGGLVSFGALGDVVIRSNIDAGGAEVDLASAGNVQLIDAVVTSGLAFIETQGSLFIDAQSLPTGFNVATDGFFQTALGADLQLNGGTADGATAFIEAGLVHLGAAGNIELNAGLGVNASAYVRASSSLSQPGFVDISAGSPNPQDAGAIIFTRGTGAGLGADAVIISEGGTGGINAVFRDCPECAGMTGSDPDPTAGTTGETGLFGNLAGSRLVDVDTAANTVLWSPAVSSLWTDAGNWLNPDGTALGRIPTVTDNVVVFGIDPQEPIFVDAGSLGGQRLDINSLLNVHPNLEGVSVDSGTLGIATDSYVGLSEFAIDGGILDLGADLDCNCGFFTTAGSLTGPGVLDALLTRIEGTFAVDGGNLRVHQGPPLFGSTTVTTLAGGTLGVLNGGTLLIADGVYDTTVVDLTLASGNVTVETNATLLTQDLVLGAALGESDSVLVNGTWIDAGQVVIGGLGSGDVQVIDGAVSVAGMVLGQGASGVGNLLIDGTATSLAAVTVAGSNTLMIVGEAGTGGVTVERGARLELRGTGTNDLFLGRQSGSSGVLDIAAIDAFVDLDTNGVLWLGAAADLVSVGGTAVIGGLGTLVGDLVNVNGTVDPGGSGVVGDLFVNGGYEHRANALLHIEVEPDVGGFVNDTLRVQDSVVFSGGSSGSVEFDFIGYTPDAADVIGFLTCGNCGAGNFASTSFAGLQTDPASFSLGVNPVAGAFELANVSFDASVFWDGGANDGLWFSATNWSNDILPGAADAVVIDVIGTDVVFDGSDQIIADLLLGADSALTIAGGSLSVVGSATFDGDLTLSGGNLVVQSLADFNGLFNLSGASSVLTVGDLAVANLNGNTNWSGGGIVGDGDLFNTGTLSVSGNEPLLLALEMTNDGSLVLNGSGGGISLAPNGGNSPTSIVNTTAGRIEFGAASAAVIGTGEIDNQGTIEVVRGNALIGVDLIQDGVLNVVTGNGETLTANLELRSPTATFTGATLLGSGSTLDLAAGSHVFQSGTALTLNGGLVVSGASVELQDALALADLSLTGGDLGGAGAVSVSSLFDWSGGNLGGSAPLSLLSGAVMNVSGGVRTPQRPVVVNGDVNIADAALLSLGAISAGSHAGSFTLNGVDAGLQLSAGAFDIAGGISGNGVLNLVNADLTLGAALDLGRLVMAGGSIGGDVDLLVAAGMNWNGGQVDGQGAFTVNNLIIAGDATLNRDLVHTGAGGLQAGSLAGTGRFTNQGVFAVTADTVIANPVSNQGQVTFAADTTAVLSNSYQQIGLLSGTVVNGTLDASAAGLAIFDGILAGNGSIIGTVQVGQTLGAEGAERGQAILSPGNSAGSMTIIGDLVLNQTSVLFLEVGGDTPGVGGYDQVDVQGNGNLAMLDGLVAVSLIDGFQGQIDGTYSPLLFRTLDPASSFSRANLIVGPGLSLDLALGPNGLQGSLSALNEVTRDVVSEVVTELQEDIEEFQDILLRRDEGRVLAKLRRKRLSDDESVEEFFEDIIGGEESVEGTEGNGDDEDPDAENEDADEDKPKRKARRVRTLICS